MEYDVVRVAQASGKVTRMTAHKKVTSIVYKIASVLAVSAVFSILTAIVYGFVLPRLFPGTELGMHLWIALGAGVSTASLVGGYVCYRDPVADPPRGKIICINSGCAVWVAALTLYLSMLVILNTYGE